MSDESTFDPHDIAACVVRTLVLYSLAEVQSGHATTLRVTADGLTFSVADDGRGHAIKRLVAGSPYLKFVYTHLDYPFDRDEAAPVQLQGLGMSLVNSLCSHLAITVQKQDATLRACFRDGRPCGHELLEVSSPATGNTVSGAVNPHFQEFSIDRGRLQRWLLGLLAVSPSLKVFFNGQLLQTARPDDA